MAKRNMENVEKRKKKVKQQSFWWFAQLT